MEPFKCKMCGAPLNVKEGMTVCECEYCGWWGLVRCLTEDFKLDICSYTEYDEIKKCADAAIKAASGDKAKELKDVWAEYSQKLKGNIDSAKEEADEKARQESERLAKRERGRFIRKSICIGLSVALCIAVVVCAFIFNVPERSDLEMGVLISVPIVLVVNSIIVTILGGIGSTKACAILPAISALIVCGSCAFAMMSHISGSVFMYIVGGIMVFGGAAIIVAACFFIPVLALGVGSDD